MTAELVVFIGLVAVIAAIFAFAGWIAETWTDEDD